MYKLYFAFYTKTIKNRVTLINLKQSDFCYFTIKYI